MWRACCLFLLAWFPAGAAAFEFQRDTLAYANDTFWAYADDGHGGMRGERRETAPAYTRHCLVMVRAALQFDRFAVFRPDEQPLTDHALRRRLRALSRIPVWARPGGRVVFPGYADLRSLSAARPRALQDELGLWWPTYWRPGNWRMALAFPRAGQERLAADLHRRLAEGRPVALFLTRFRPLNHAVVAFRALPERDGRDRWECWDPNDPARPLVLEYDRTARSFRWPRTAYWGGGVVNVFPIYRHPFR